MAKGHGCSARRFIQHISQCTVFGELVSIVKFKVIVPVALNQNTLKLLVVGIFVYMQQVINQGEQNVKIIFKVTGQYLHAKYS